MDTEQVEELDKIQDFEYYEKLAEQVAQLDSQIRLRAEQLSDVLTLERSRAASMSPEIKELVKRSEAAVEEIATALPKFDRAQQTRLLAKI